MKFTPAHKRKLTWVLALTAVLILIVHFLQLNSLNSIIEFNWQYLDIPTLKDSPIDSLIYLHSQPPLLNFIVWVLSFSPIGIYESFIILNAFLTSLIALVIFTVVFSYWNSFLLASFASLAFTLSPAALLNICYPFYPVLTQFGYACLIYSFWSLKNKFKLAPIIFSFSVIFLSLLRTSFSVVHGVFFIILFMLYARHVYDKKKIFTGILFLTTMLIFIVPVKNYWLYDFFGSSSYAPLNIAKGTGTTGLALLYFPSPKEIKESQLSLKCKHSYHFQDSSLFKLNGNPNYNSCYMIAYANYAKPIIAKNYNISKHFHQILWYVVQYFTPPDKYDDLMRGNRSQIENYSDLTNAFYLSYSIDRYNQEVRLILLISLIAGLYWAIRKKDRFMMILLTVFITHFLTHVLTDGMEGRRFVFDIEFLFWIIGSITLFEKFNYHNWRKKSNYD